MFDTDPVLLLSVVVLLESTLHPLHVFGDELGWKWGHLVATVFLIEMYGASTKAHASLWSSFAFKPLALGTGSSDDYAVFPLCLGSKTFHSLFYLAADSV